MKIQFSPTSLRYWFDRNPIDVSFYLTMDATAPHGLTTRGSYTVPSNKKALITNVYARAYRSTVAAPIGLARMWFVKNLAGTPIYTMDCLSYDNTVKMLWDDNAAMNYLLVDGDTFTVQSVDGSTGGQVYYAFEVTITEFDK